MHREASDQFYGEGVVCAVGSRIEFGTRFPDVIHANWFTEVAKANAELLTRHPLGVECKSNRFWTNLAIRTYKKDNYEARLV